MQLKSTKAFMHFLSTQRWTSLVVGRRRRWLHQTPHTAIPRDAQHLDPPSKLASAPWKPSAPDHCPDLSGSQQMQCFPPFVQQMKLASCQGWLTGWTIHPSLLACSLHISLMRLLPSSSEVAGMQRDLYWISVYLKYAEKHTLNFKF
jgi:hypothetical protein